MSDELGQVEVELPEQARRFVPGTSEVLPDGVGVIYPNAEVPGEAWASTAFRDVGVLKWVWDNPGQNINQVAEGMGYGRYRMGPIALQLKDASAEGYVMSVPNPDRDLQLQYFPTVKLTRALGVRIAEGAWVVEQKALEPGRAELGPGS